MLPYTSLGVTDLRSGRNHIGRQEVVTRVGEEYSQAVHLRSSCDDGDTVTVLVHVRQNVEKVVDHCFQATQDRTSSAASANQVSFVVCLERQVQGKQMLADGLFTGAADTGNIQALLTV